MIFLPGRNSQNRTLSICYMPGLEFLILANSENRQTVCNTEAYRVKITVRKPILTIYWNLTSVDVICSLSI